VIFPTGVQLPPGIKLVIEVLPGGNVNVNGPITDKYLCQILMDMAMDLIVDHISTQVERRVVPATKLPDLKHG